MLVDNQWGTVRIWSAGKTVSLSVEWESAAGEWNDQVLATVPEGLRPPTNTVFPCVRNLSDGKGMVSVNVNADGSVRLVNHASSQPSGDYVAVTCCWAL